MILKSKEAKQKLLEGINGIADVVKLTLGARGKTVMLRNQYGLGFEITKDGVKTAVATNFEDDPIKQSGAEFVKNAARKTVQEAGDNTTSTVIFTQSACNAVYKELELGVNPNELLQDLKSDLDTIVDYIKEKSIQIESNSDIERIAYVSGNNSSEIGTLLKDIYDNCGRNVEIDIVETSQEKTDFEKLSGYTLKNTGYASNVFINNYDKGRIEFLNPRIYVLNSTIRNLDNHLQEILSINSNPNDPEFRPLVIIAETIEEKVLEVIAKAYGNRQLFDVAVVDTTLIAEDRKNAFIDTSVVLNAEYKDDFLGNYGTCDKIVIEKNEVTFIGGAGDITKHLDTLKNKPNKTSFDEKRIFSLETSAAVIKVGGKLESEVSELKDRIEDAVFAVKSALEEGYLPGGSSVFISARKELKFKTRIMPEILLSCYNQLMLNANLEPMYFLKEIERGKFGTAYNLIDNKIQDFNKAGIYDSAKATRCSITNAIHTAINFGTIEAIVS